MEVIIKNGYELHALDIFTAELTRITELAEALAIKDPDEFFHHPTYKLFEAIQTNIFTNVPAEPNHPDFRLGKTLGKKYTSWRRIKKKSLPTRYRLFFQFKTDAPKAIIYAWINDETTQRKAGSKTDVYYVFEKMLEGNRVPNSWGELIAAATPIPPLKA
ncbi:hypothetical protein EGC79_11065 [Shewanella vesiculosa]|uniref:type II toxin-antitoxin system YhaV family toxin n=1 Tax=Shewanella vesiculosa TaxID=518738 RepID=UPI000F4DBD44|nr:type II toxin-antitoxin system YhaV family toxin [Shewanella vesiculosa]RPA50624.1 hypothetical protein EGC79_11065 [Shewanella vesiculosa]UJL44374.1 type II toxin-antitoxin system YhaV family toxin [Shewanella vesiculosa]